MRLFKDFHKEDERRGKLVVFLIVVGVIIYLGYSFFPQSQGWINEKFPAENIDKFFAELSTKVEEIDMRERVYSSDLDGDQVDDAIELMLMSSNQLSDTDNDGYSDYREFVTEHDPFNTDKKLDEDTLTERYNTFVSSYLFDKGDILEFYYSKLASAKEREKDFAGAGQALEKVIELNKSSENYIETIAFYSENDLYREGLAVANQFVEKYPNKWSAYNWRGFNYLRLNQMSNAETDFKHAIDLGGQDVWLYNNYGVTLANKQQWSQALEYYYMAVKVEEEHPYIWQNISDMHYNLGEYELEKQATDRAKELEEMGYEK